MCSIEFQMLYREREIGADSRRPSPSGAAPAHGSAHVHQKQLEIDRTLIKPYNN
jgi:hypothetical protein